MKKWYKECPFCKNEIKKEATKCQYCEEILPKEKPEVKECPFCKNEIKYDAVKCQYCHKVLNAIDKKDTKKIPNKKEKIKKELCRFCKKDYWTEEDSRVIHATRELNRVSAVVARYVKYETMDIVIPRCKKCHEKQKRNILKSVLKLIWLPFLIGFILWICFRGEIKEWLYFWLWLSFFWLIRFFFTFNKISGSLSYSDYPKWKELKKEWRYSSFS